MATDGHATCGEGFEVVGILKGILGLGAKPIAGAVETVAGAFRPNAEAQSQRAHEVVLADYNLNALSLDQFKAEFAHAPTNWFDSFVNGLNRLPRPLMAFGAVGLFIYSMIDPVGFGLRMEVLNEVPPELWGLLSGITAFYFGIRELQKSREGRVNIARLSAIEKALESRRKSREPKSPDPEASGPKDHNPVIAHMLGG